MQFHALVHLKKNRNAYVESDESVLVKCDFTLAASASYS